MKRVVIRLELLASFLTSFIPAATGCAGSSEELDASLGDEDIAEARLAACTDPGSSLGGSNNFYSMPADPDWAYSYSPTSTYGSSACPTAYVFEVTGLAGSYPNLYARYAGAVPTSQAECNISGVTATAYGWVPPRCNQWICSIGHWEQLADEHGDMTPTEGFEWVLDAARPNGGYCLAHNDHGFLRPQVEFHPMTTKYSKVRIAATAFTFFQTKKVVAEVTHWFPSP
ncbi:hypothetical protein WME89_33785 [Sorangium sp. So ce321]|uniref:hypothetical protein n=1 Tax=Sorangium sp. So ce321 TaxID=3133300 RepID=UPI003F635C06